jgi:hypothetical protein
MTRLLVILLAATALTACDPIDRLEGKSPGREHVENLIEMGVIDAVVTADPVPDTPTKHPVAVVEMVPATVPETLPEPALVVEVAEPTPVVPAPELVVEPEVVPEPVAIEPEVILEPVIIPDPVCYPIFRILSCDDEGNEVWL